MTSEKILETNQQMQKNLSEELGLIIDHYLTDYPLVYRSMIEYQLGMDGQLDAEKAQGKRLRPLFVLLVCQVLGGDWQKALPAAASVELLHNFSLIHDDIQDESDTRRGRATVWKKWGIAQAINIGDAMLTLSFLVLGRLEPVLNHEIINSMKMLLEKTCLTLTRGQFLDLAYEKENILPMDLYWDMVNGKTAALLSTSCRLGAIVSHAEQAQVDMIGEFGKIFGMAFQVQDDYLGIWGDPALTGKSKYTDLLSRKKTYPILQGLTVNSLFSKLWKTSDEIDEELAMKLATYLEQEGIKEQVIQTYSDLYDNAWQVLNSIGLNPKATHALISLLRSIRQRES